MKDPSLALRNGIYTALNGNINSFKSDGTTVNTPVYDKVPKDATFPYIVIDNIEFVDEPSDNNTFVSEYLVDLDIVTGFSEGAGGNKPAMTATDNVLQTIRPRNQRNYMDLSDDGFNIITIRVDSIIPLREADETHDIYRRIIRLRFLIDEI